MQENSSRIRAGLFMPKNQVRAHARPALAGASLDAPRVQHLLDAVCGIESGTNLRRQCFARGRAKPHAGRVRYPSNAVIRVHANFGPELDKGQCSVRSIAPEPTLAERRYRTMVMAFSDWHSSRWQYAESLPTCRTVGGGKNHSRLKAKGRSPDFCRTEKAI